MFDTYHTGRRLVKNAWCTAAKARAKSEVSVGIVDVAVHKYVGSLRTNARTATHTRRRKDF